MTSVYRPAPLGLPARLGFGVMTLLAFMVTLMALRYVSPDPIGGAPNVLANRFAFPGLMIHAGFGALALALGPFQFLPRLRRTRRRLHRAIGATYAGASLIAAAAGLVLAIGTTAGPIAMTGFAMVGVVWILTTSLGIRAIVRADYAAHRRWMIRSFALTLAAVTLRLELTYVGMAGLPFEQAYQAISFLSWVPNLALAEIWIALTARQNQPAAFRGP